MNKTVLIAVASVLVLAGAGFFIFSSNSVSSQSEERVEAQLSGDVSEAWVRRCDENEAGEEIYCEILQRLNIQESGARLLDFAIGFPADSDAARGALIVPLGVLIEPGLDFQIDDGEVFKVRLRYCLQQGCYAFINLNEELIGQMKSGSQVSVTLTNLQGQRITIPVTLTGFTAAIEDITPEG